VWGLLTATSGETVTLSEAVRGIKLTAQLCLVLSCSVLGALTPLPACNFAVVVTKTQGQLYILLICSAEDFVAV
jgi:hypothetical protein